MAGSPRLTRLRRPLAALVGLAAATTFVALVDPNHGHYPLCPTKYLTGLDCPFCGGLRSVHSLAHGDLVGAIHHNALVLVAAPLVAWWWLRWARREWRGEVHAPADPAGSKRLQLAVLMVALGFMLVRNLAIGAGLASGSAA